MRVIHTAVEMAKACLSAKRPLGLVPTMGYLHDGHLALIRRARNENSILAVSIFVNPAQFGPHEDFDVYPRDLTGDLSMLQREDVDLVFTPSTSDMYQNNARTWVDVEILSSRLEGFARPEHFRGVSTVVTKLLNIVKPDYVYFGQKDGQQVTIIKRIVTDLNISVTVVVLPTVREIDGLAVSSRNVYLTPEQRNAAPVIYRSLLFAERLWDRGERDGDALRNAATQILLGEPLVDSIDYVSVADADTLEELDFVSGFVMVSAAVYMGETRLIDCVLLGDTKN